MKSEKGSILVIAIFILVLIGILIGGIFLFRKGNFQIPNLINNTSINKSSEIITKEGPAIDLSKPPADKEYLDDFINHCMTTPGYKWSGSECTKN